MYAVVAVATYGFTAWMQAFFHQRFGHRPAGRWLFRNHVRFHHTIYRRMLTTPRYLDEERSNTAFYVLPIATASAIAYLLLPGDMFVVVAASMIATYLAHIYVHVQFHITNSWLERFHWFLRLQRLHSVHHADMSKNHAILMPFWDRVFGTYQPAESQPSTRKATPRGPRSSLLTGNLPDLEGDKLAFAVRCERQYGPIVQLRLWNQPFFLVSDAAMIGEVLVTKHRNFTKPMIFKTLEVAFGRGIAAAEHDMSMHTRQILQPAFHRTRLEDVARVAEACTQRMIERWETGAIVDVEPAIRTLCLEIFAQGMLGETLDDDQQGVVFEAFARVQEAVRSFSCLPKERLPFPSTVRFKRAFRDLDALVDELVRRHADRAHDDNLLSLLLRARANGDPLMTTRQIRDELVTLFLAGYETVASSVHFALVLLSEHPGEARLDNIDNVIKETHRLYPPGYQIGRVTIEPCEIGGHAIPANTHVVIYPWAVHRSPRYFEEPDAFRPARWSDGSTRSLPRFAYLPYGAGPHTCIGAALARVEMTAILSTIIQRARLTLRHGTRIVPEPRFTLTVAGGSLPMIVERL
jgi:cytochrome P450